MEEEEEEESGVVSSGAAPTSYTNTQRPGSEHWVSVSSRWQRKATDAAFKGTLSKLGEKEFGEQLYITRREAQDRKY
ncbi:hypothetical protein EYF80_010190 [Liparis tanakae]|uniref:Uncharacterized protein n=1 Tax=Liparis tanakae TaxID=230148 RepID=A0A4Z2IPL3_9TELE|nr:hypothetical protein EYF80_010190 [Liparis tanakae]